MLARIVMLCLALFAASGCSGKKSSPAACPEPRNGPTSHEGDITGEETWLADDSPHVVTQDVNVRDGATLTIEPCAVVHVAEGKAINVAYPLTPNTGTLLAEGTAEKPILFSGLDGARWAHVFVHSPGTARFSHVTFSGGGSDALSANATLVAFGLGETPTRKDLFVDHVTISGSLGAGAVLERNAAFATGSTQLVIDGSGNDDFPYPLEIGEHALDTLPDGAYTGNRRDEILIRPEGANQTSGLQESATMRDLGVPYHVGTPTSADGSSLRVGSGDGGPLAVLTIEPGVVVKFEPGKRMSLEVEHFTGDFAASGEIRAVGTAERPIVFTSAAETPAAGDWMGLWFGGNPSASNLLEHVRIDYAGAECLCTLLSCNAETDSEAAVIFTSQPPSPFLTNSTIANSAGHGITRGYRGATVDFAPTNTFEDLIGCVQTINQPQDGTCPDPLPSCM